MHKPNYVYRIPKHVDARLMFGGMDWRGWIAVAAASVIAILQYMLLPPHSFNGLMFVAARAILIVGVTVIFARDPQILALLRQLRYHKRHKILIRWESDPDAYLQAQTKNQNQ